MEDVWNWQIGRNMKYKYKSHRPKKQWCIVFDLNKCIGCQTCSIACKTTWTSGKGQEYMFWNNVESKPYGSYPMAYDIKVLEALGLQEWNKNGPYKGKTVFEAAQNSEIAANFYPEGEDWMNPNRGEDECTDIVEKGDHVNLPHDKWFFYLPRTCAHCTYPACLAACPRKAIYKRDEDGIVLIDQTRCKGYQECVKACPYKKSLYNPYTRVSEKCIGCYPAVEEGRQPMCVQNCIGKIRVMGFISPPWRAREDNPTDYFVHKKEIALPFYPQLGLEPHVYYIPPIHANKDYLQQMFGPKVEEAIENYKNLKNDRKTQGLLCLIGSSDKIIDRFKVDDDFAYGYDADGKEITKVPLKEKFVVRKKYDKLLQITRTNTP